MRIPSSYSQAMSQRENQAMTPMIDVVFLLLIFFVCVAAGQVREAVFPTELSAPGTIESDPREEQDPWRTEVWLKLRSDAEGRTLVEMNGRQFASVQELASPLTELAKFDVESPLILDVGPLVPMRDVIAMYDLCRGAGFQSVNFAARAEDVQ